MVRSKTWPSPGEGGAYSSIRKSDALGSPTGRETRTTRFACWDMVVSSVFCFLVVVNQRIQLFRFPPIFPSPRAAAGRDQGWGVLQRALFVERPPTPDPSPPRADARGGRGEEAIA